MSGNLRVAASDNCRGFSIIYIPLILLLLVAFLAMAVDTGRIRLAKAQLQGAADASARAGAWSIPKTIPVSATNAKNVAEANNVAETNVVFDTNEDIEWGIWDKSTTPPTFTALVDEGATTNDERQRSNAAHTRARASAARGSSVPLWITPHVVTFDRKSKGGKLSVQSNLFTEAIATISGGPSNYGFVGIDGISANGTATMIGGAASNGNIDLSAGGNIVGDARPGMGPPPGQVLLGTDATVSGWQAPLDYLLQYDPIVMPALNPLPLPVGNGSATATLFLTGGNNPANPTVYTGDIPKNININVDGYVKIVTNADIDLRGGTTQNAQTPLNAAKLQIEVVGSHSIDLGGNQSQWAHVLAPESEVRVHGTADFYGHIVAKRLRYIGTVTLIADNVGPDVTPYKITLVK